jgi:hypothetical protein
MHFFNKAFVLFFIVSGTVNAQNNSLYVPRNIQQSINDHVRNTDGTPGGNYWENHSDYTINLTVSPPSRIINGEETVNYRNNSPDTLKELVVRLYQDIYKAGNTRLMPLGDSDATNGTNIEELSINGTPINVNEKPRAVLGFNATAGDLPDNDVLREGTNLIIKLTTPLQPGQSLTLHSKWNYILNKNTLDREGVFDSTTFFIAYFYPQISVYDDYEGWDKTDFNFVAEFYNDLNNYHVNINVPKNFVVWATGNLLTPGEVLSYPIVQKMYASQKTDSVIHVIDKNDLKQNQITTDHPENTWKFQADSVSDFAMGISNHYLWDATSVVVDETNNRRVSVNTAYRGDAIHYPEVIGIARKAVDFLSHDLPGVPFPFPKETVFQAFDEMEYPMMVNDVDDTSGLTDELDLTSHEISHSYFPFYMGTNEHIFGFMDEGWATYFGYKFILNKYKNPDAIIFDTDLYEEFAGNNMELPPIMPTIFVAGKSWESALYQRPGLAYANLEDMLGTDLFKKCLQTYIARWHDKHPTPWDFYNTFNDVSKQNLNWFFNAWFMQLGYPDLGVKVKTDKNNYTVTIEKIGQLPEGIHLLILYTDGTSDAVNETASIWKDGKSEYVITKSTNKKLKKVELVQNAITPDVDLSNNEVDY